MQAWYGKVSSTQVAYLLWVVTIVAAIGSLSLSNIFGFTPCELCWYQRAFMFPLPLVVGVGIYFKDKFVTRYVLPLSIGGLLVSSYHVLIQYGIINYSPDQCSALVSCTERYINWFGFVTIPLLSFVTFLTITGIALLNQMMVKNENTK